LAFIPPKVKDDIITHPLSQEEEKVYLLMKDILVAVKEKATQAKLLGNKSEHKKFSSYVLVMVSYLRQALICPLIPLTSIMMESVNMEKRSALAVIINKEVNKLDIQKYLDNVNSIESSRIKSLLTCLDKHPNETVIIFSCYASFIKLLEYILKRQKRSVFVMKKELNPNQRGHLVKDFSDSVNGVLLMTYELGSKGLNLQTASVVMLVDQCWNSSATTQSIGRIFRYGQIHNVIYIYFFSSNTGIEHIIFEKQHAKSRIVEELQTGKQTLKIPKLNMKEVIRIIALNDNKKILEEIYF
jgi:SNF2 family DNA or RNA helicase